MREILFRGKRTDNGEWAEGDLYRKTDALGEKETIIFQDKGADAFKKNIVEPETVGQYTGLRDKNGKKIFEGDICKYENETGEYGIGIICYDYVRWISGNVTETNTLTPLFYLKCSTEWKVIGNIFDNPELLDC